ncbi:hypothetical protein BJX76DRAFT_317833 [Aspergillus varians]
MLQNWFHAHPSYGVKSTAICCCPSCSARLARRTNVVVCDTIDEYWLRILLEGGRSWL